MSQSEPSTAKKNCYYDASTLHEVSPKPNPFATLFVSPGKLPFLFPDNQTARDLITRWNQNKQRGQIVGPHGSGKSTLLKEFVRLIEAEHDVQHLDPKSLQRAKGLPILLRKDKPIVIAIDGFEQISRKLQRKIIRITQQHEIGLLVTSHHELALPVIHRTVASLATFQRLVSHLLKNQLQVPLATQIVTDVFEQHQGDIREALFSLYDIFESRA